MSDAIAVTVTGGSDEDRNHVASYITASLDEGGFFDVDFIGREGEEKPQSGSILALIQEANPDLISRKIRVVDAHTLDQAGELLEFADEQAEEQEEEEMPAMADV